jgi:orotidine 5'-phosphate decarboxylase subfamily 2
LNYFERLQVRARTVDSAVCVGLDPHFDRMPVGDIAAHNRKVIEATAPFAACYKPNFAFYEQFGIAGLAALQETVAAVPDGIPVLGDVKRGDIGSTAAAYARAAFDVWGFDAVTLHPYMGLESVRPFLEYADKGVYIVCRTSANEGAVDLQESVLESGLRLYEEVASIATRWSPRIGLVVGATAPAEIARVRAIAPEASLLIPGVGAQGGDAAAAIQAAGSEPGSLIVSSSRGIYYSDDPGAAARELRDRLRQAAVSA